ncbi:pseudaminic acid synthase [Pedobacter heparinus]|uniref:N-acylneuraminate-9-phosphate synthase n=1 Tax=Pedobacter heparinus (strain ATCC 13125 / DSM 2366 / CIP 104194 / JCM 7457 / NBRC 12017 / NCIMB 9290 / NRRL B-14731 / HIM 762-3) TaxID=485917 RepID=C6XVQ8_PEDHD|nr:pseudaminic acid synthase [Pedobacter heparinus]ACU06133.1 N-acylneuraminate-9-phosphate synthase [Pedobacter heparinus DSM 2366]
MQEIKIGNYTISPNHKPFLIAEMSGNHNRSIDNALKIIDAAAKAGAHAIKLQTYTADTLTIDVSHGEFNITDSKSLWNGRNLYNLYEEAHTPWEWHKALFERAKEKEILIFSTPFDDTSVDFLEELGVPAYKVASFENNHLPLLRRIAKTGKPVIMSTGISTLADIEIAVRTLKENGCKELILLKCTSTYPATPENTNLLTIPHMAELFNCYVGLSDHTVGVGVSIASIALGARVIEKHFTINRSEGGVDSAFSMEPDEFKILVQETERAFLSLGKVSYGILEEEKKSLTFKRSIYVVEDMREGDLFTEKNIRIIRPGLGLSPKYFEQIIGKRIAKDAKRGTALTFDLI